MDAFVEGSLRMGTFLIIGYCIFILFILFLVIKAAVSKGIDSSMEIKMLKYEIRDLKEQLKTVQQDEQTTNIINKKI